MKTIFISKRILMPFTAVVLFFAGGLAALIFCPKEAVPAGGSGGSRPIYEVADSSGKVGISFDASWGAEHTGDILDTLDSHGVKATFFLVNIWLEEYPDKAREIALRGHEIGMHSATHPQCSKLTDEQFIDELQSNREKIIATTGYTPSLFRPPFGDYNDTVVELTRKMGCECIQWSVDSLDWKDLSADEIYKRVTKDIHSGDIILFHNNGLHTAEALPEILRYLSDNGLRAVPISQMLIKGGSYVDSSGVQRAAK